MTGPTGPFLYDDDPAPLHTGTPQRSGKLLVLVFGATVLAAVLLVVLMPLVKGSPDDQARQVTGVFLAALDKGDTETAYGLLCEDERARVAPEDIAAEYLEGDGLGSVVAVQEAEFEGAPSRELDIEWPGGGRARYVVINSDGPHVCGATAAG
jgi:hypothetical protein